MAARPYGLARNQHPSLGVSAADPDDHQAGVGSVVCVVNDDQDPAMPRDQLIIRGRRDCCRRKETDPCVRSELRGHRTKEPGLSDSTAPRQQRDRLTSVFDRPTDLSELLASADKGPVMGENPVRL